MAWAITLRKLNQNSTGGLKKIINETEGKSWSVPKSTYALSKRDFGYSVAAGCCRLPRGSSTVLDLTLVFSQRVGEVAVYLQKS